MESNLEASCLLESGRGGGAGFVRYLSFVRGKGMNLRIAASQRCVDRVFRGMAFPQVEHLIELITLNCLPDVAIAIPN